MHPLSLDLDLLTTKAIELKMGDYNTLLGTNKKKVINIVEQECVDIAFLFLNKSNAKMHIQLKKDVANNYSKGIPKHTPLICINSDE